MVFEEVTRKGCEMDRKRIKRQTEHTDLSILRIKVDAK